MGRVGARAGHTRPAVAARRPGGQRAVAGRDGDVHRRARVDDRHAGVGHREGVSGGVGHDGRIGRGNDPRVGDGRSGVGHREVTVAEVVPVPRGREAVRNDVAHDPNPVHLDEREVTEDHGGLGVGPPPARHVEVRAGLGGGGGREVEPRVDGPPRRRRVGRLAPRAVEGLALDMTRRHERVAARVEDVRHRRRGDHEVAREGEPEVPLVPRRRGGVGRGRRVGHDGRVGRGGRIAVDGRVRVERALDRLAAESRDGEGGEDERGATKRDRGHGTMLSPRMLSGAVRMWWERDD